MEEKQPIPIEDNMSDDLKFAINYLNERNISLDDKIDVHFETEEEANEDDEEFNGLVSAEDMNDTDIEDDGEDEILEEMIADMIEMRDGTYQNTTPKSENEEKHE